VGAGGGMAESVDPVMGRLARWPANLAGPVDDQAAVERVDAGLRLAPQGGGVGRDGRLGLTAWMAEAPVERGDHFGEPGAQMESIGHGRETSCRSATQAS